jgi:hypothetical protein
MRTHFLVLTASTALMLAGGFGPALAKHRHVALAHHHRPAPVAVQQPAPPPTFSPGSDYRNHIVEDGMTQDQLDRATGR